MEVATAIGPPAWVKQFNVPGLEFLEQQREKVLAEIRALEQSLAGIDNELRNHRATCDYLLCGEGPELVEAVAATLGGLGADVRRSEGDSPLMSVYLHGRGERPDAVVLAVGGPGCVERRDVRALVDAVNELWDRLGDPCPKGVLMANAHNQDDPRERNGGSFPQELHGFCRQNNLCLLTTVQLFNAYYALMTGDLKDGSAFLESLLKTTLEYPKFRNCNASVRG